VAAWAHGGSYGDRVRFLMLCVETGASGLRTAKAFGKEFRLPATVVNGYIESKSELPRFGQLGCGGFVVLGRHGEFVAARTVPSYLDRGALAFAAVEALLAGLGVQRSTPATGGGGGGGEGKGSAAAAPLLLAAVAHAQMDREHEGLADAADALRQQRSLASLRRLRREWAEHCAHEEALFEQHDFAGHRSRGDLAGTASHVKHHRALLASMDAAVQSCEEGAECSRGGCCAPGLVSDESVRRILGELQQHGDVYDAAYVGRLG